LWALDFRTGGANDNPNALYFTAGINGEADGLFGSIAPAPEPGTLSLMFGAVGSLGAKALVRRRKRSA
jgi:PEP-CTERM motif